MAAGEGRVVEQPRTGGAGRDGKHGRLSIHDGDLITGSRTSAGFASGAHPDWAALAPLRTPTAEFLKEQVR
jgi:hypothetical protein